MQDSAKVLILGSDGNKYDDVERVGNNEGDKKLGREHILFGVIIDVLHYAIYLGCSQDLRYICYYFTIR